MLGQREWEWNGFLLEAASTLFPARLLSRPVSRVMRALTDKHWRGAVLTKTTDGTISPVLFFLKPSQRTEWSQVRRLKHLHPILQVWAKSPGRQSNCMMGEFGLLSWIIPCWILCEYVSVTRIGSFSARILKGKAWASQELCNIFLAGNKFRPLIFFFFFPKTLEGNVGLQRDDRCEKTWLVLLRLLLRPKATIRSGIPLCQALSKCRARNNPWLGGLQYWLTFICLCKYQFTIKLCYLC